MQIVRYPDKALFRKTSDPSSVPIHFFRAELFFVDIQLTNCQSVDTQITDCQNVDIQIVCRHKMYVDITYLLTYHNPTLNYVCYNLIPMGAHLSPVEGCQGGQLKLTFSVILSTF
jgi:hypothetical protein